MRGETTQLQCRVAIYVAGAQGEQCCRSCGAAATFTLVLAISPTIKATLLPVCDVCMRVLGMAAKFQADQAALQRPAEPTGRR